MPTNCCLATISVAVLARNGTGKRVAIARVKRKRRETIEEGSEREERHECAMG